jgi:hypothetical protein
MLETQHGDAALPENVPETARRAIPNDRRSLKLKA